MLPLVSSYTDPTHFPKYDGSSDLAFWNKHTRELNQRYGLADSSPQPEMNRSAASSSPSEYPVIGLEKLTESPKGRKTQDMDRILHSAASEDWVSWNFFQLMLQERPATWWREMLDVAHQHNADVHLPEALANSNPVLWRLAASPETYQEDSRRRMLNSRNPNWVAKAANSESVEGPSEIDITIESPDMVIFIEAKLGSDISMNTTYDPHRNQIARNIDCLLERAESKDAAFWILVKDEDPSRAYASMPSWLRSRARVTKVVEAVMSKHSRKPTPALRPARWSGQASCAQHEDLELSNPLRSPAPAPNARCAGQ